MLMVALITASVAKSIPPLNLLSNDNFVILAGAAITGIPPVAISGNVGLSPASGSSITGFDGTNVNGILYVVDAGGPVGSVINAALLTTAKGDLTTAYNDAAGRTPVPTGNFLNPNGGNIGGLNLVPGLYKFTSDAAITGSDVTLTGNSTDVWIFQIATSLNVGSGIHVILAGGAQASNIFWQVGSSATLGTYCDFKGTILADQSISLATGAAMDGRALAFTGAVTMGSGVTPNKPAPIFSVNPALIAFGNVINNTIKMDSVTVTNIGTADLIISTVTSSNVVFTVTPLNATIPSGVSRKFYVTFAPLVNGLKNGKIYFNHNAANLIDSIIVSGTGVTAALPVFSVNPDNLNFGNVNNATTKTDSVTVTNTGTADLIISSVTRSNTLFTITPTTGTLTPGATKKFYVTFAPLVNGLQSGYFYYHHNAANAIDSISVNGTGTTGALPIFSVNPTILNFGNVTNSTTKMDSVTVTNTGTADLIINSVTSSKTLFTVTPTSGTLAPGATKKFFVTFAPLINGLQNGKIYFHHNAVNAIDSISVSGTGVSPVFSVSPTSLNFGNVNIGLNKKDSVTVTNTGTSDLIITSVICSKTTYTVTPIAGTLTPGTTRKFYITYTPLINGLQNGYVYFHHNAANAIDSISVSATGVSPVFSVNPNSLNFGNVSNGTTKMDSVTVTNIGTLSLIISSVTSTKTLFTVTPTSATIAPGATRIFYVTFAPLTNGLQNGSIIFNHNAGNGTDSISVSGTGVSSSFLVNPSSLSFGNVNNNTTKMDSVTVTNAGTVSLIISSVISSKAVYTVTPTSATIAPGATRKFYVTFAPLINGLQSGYVYFNHNAGNGIDSISVSGTGVSSNFSVNPNSLNFGNVNDNTTKMDSVTVTNLGTVNLNINSVLSSNILFTITPATAIILPGATRKFFVTFAPLVNGLQNGKIYFNHNAANGIDSISVSGTGVSSSFSVNPTNLNFGNVSNGTTKMDSVIVTNTGTITLTITNVTSSKTVYTISPTSANILPGATHKFYVTFAPLVNGLQSGYVYFYHNAGNGIDSISVNGTGVSSNFSVNPNSLNFGNVSNNTTKIDSVTVTNLGSVNLIITSIISSNILFTVTPAAAIILPGATRKIFVTFAPLVNGLQNGHIYFYHNAANGLDSISVSGTGVSSSFLVNLTNLNFGNVNNNTTKTDSVTVTNNGAVNLIISSVLSSNILFTVTPAAAIVLPGATKRFYITFAPLTNGLKNGQIYFYHNALNGLDSISVNGTGVSSTFSVAPNNILFGNVSNGTTKMDSVTVTNLGTINLNINSVISSNTLFTVTPTSASILPGATRKFYVTFAPIVNGIQNGKIYFNHNAAGGIDSISVSGKGVSSSFSVNPISLFFGNVNDGSTKMDSVTVTNIGTLYLNINSIVSSNTLFTVSPTSAYIIPGESRKFYITFAPFTNGLQNGNIYFHHNAVNGIDSISVSGIGVSPHFTVNPTNLDYGNVSINTIKMDSVSVTNNGGSTLIINSIISSNILYTITPAAGILQPGATRKFYITFAPLVEGIEDGYIYFHHNAANGIDSISVSGICASSHFSVAPNNLDFGSVHYNRTKMDSVTVTNTGTVNLIINSVLSSNLIFTVTPATGIILPGATRKFYVTFAPLLDGVQNGYIYFHHNAVNGIDSISVTGRGGYSRFTVNPNILDFGFVNTGVPKTDSVTVTNTGTISLYIYSIVGTQTYFSISPTFGTIQPGSSQKFYVTFAPMGNGLLNAKYYFHHDADNGIDSISVSGTGMSPVFTASPLSIDFGNVIDGVSKTDSVTVSNTGNNMLVINNITSSNTIFTVTPTFGTIQPGSTKKFYITYAPLADGLQNAKIYFYHNPLTVQDSISVNGTGVNPKFSADPKSLNFGNVNNGTTKMDSIVISNTGTTDLIISETTTSNYHFTFAVFRTTIKPGTSQKFYVMFTPLTSGFDEGYIVFNFNATNAKDSIYVSGTGVGNDVTPSISINPTSLDFGNVNDGTTKQDSITITNPGTGNLTIVWIRSGNVFYSINPENAIIFAGASQKFYVTFAPLTPGLQTGWVYIYHNANRGLDSVYISGTGIGVDISPKFSVNFTNLDFGTVFIGTTKQMSVIVTNTGMTDMIISGVKSNDAHYIITPVIGTIKPGASQEFFITFAPTVAGQVSGEILFNYNAGIGTINVTGKGLAIISLITIKAARDLPLGTEFIIEGIVTRSLGSYTRIQDLTGALTIYQPTGTFYNDVANFDIQNADLLRIQGKISEMKNLKVISGNDLTGFQRLSRLNELPTPVKVTLSEIAHNGEQYESSLITIDNLTIINSFDEIVFHEARTYQTTDASDQTNSVSIQIGNAADTDEDGMPFISHSVTFLGVLSQSSESNPSSGYQLTPVLPTDLFYVPTTVWGSENENQNSLSDNYPNPFSASTTIQYSLGNADFVSLKVYNVLGNEVANVVNSFQDAGTHTVSFSATSNSISLESGLYIYCLRVGSFVSTKQMILVK
jgi:hypothetical protein